MSKTERQQYKIAGPATWELIRAAYLGGESARALAERFGVGEHAIRKRITVEKWTKRDYAAALEARGVSREKVKPDFIEEGVLREQMRQATEARETREATAREVEVSALIDQIASSEDAGDIAAAIERRALAQANAAMVQGRSKEAVALASMAEMMRKRAAAVAAPLKAAEGVALEALTPAELEQRALAQAGEALSRGEAAGAKALTAVAEQMRKRVDEERQREEASRAQAASQVAEVKRCRELELAEKFRYAAFLAYCMVHNPKGAPAIFVDLVAGIRREAFGEGDEESYAAARRSALESRRYFGLDEDTWDAAFMATFPDDEDEARDPSPAWEGAAHPRPSASPTPSPALAGEGTVEN